MDALDSQRWEEFENLGEEAVRLNIAKGLYGSARHKLAEEWLARLERSRDSESESRKKRYDKIAAIAAIVAAVAAIVSAIVSSILLFLQ